MNNTFSSTVTVNIEVQKRLVCPLYVCSLDPCKGGKGTDCLMPNL